jgi:siroheme synthase
MMAIGARAELASRLIAHGWGAATPAAIICGASTPDEWIWTGALSNAGAAVPPDGAAGVLVIGEVVEVRHALEMRRGPLRSAEETKAEEKYGGR